MPSEYSLYRKIQVALEITKALRVESWVDIKERILSQAPPNFVTKQYDIKHDVRVEQVSERSIRRTVSICRALQLIDDSGDLTPAGRQALRQSTFDRILAEQVNSFLREKGVQVSTLNKLINKSLRSTPVIMPTAMELWEHGGRDIPLLLFSQMLTLLSQCGGAESSQRKVYLEFREA